MLSEKHHIIESIHDSSVKIDANHWQIRKSVANELANWFDGYQSYFDEDDDVQPILNGIRGLKGEREE